MRKKIYFLFSIGLILFIVGGSNNNARAQRRKSPKAKPTVAAAPKSAEELEYIETLQAAKVYTLLAELQLSLAAAYLENRPIGERDAKRALVKIDGEQRKNPSSLMANFGQARGYLIFSDYLLNRNSYGKLPASDKAVRLNAEIIRTAVARGFAIDANFPFLVAVRAGLRSLDCRSGRFISQSDCYEKPLEDLSRAIAFLPDEPEIFTIRSELFERFEKTALAEADKQSVKNLYDALDLKSKLDKETSETTPFHAENAEIDTLYFVNTLRLMLDENIKPQLAKDAALTAAFRKKLFEYFERADMHFTEANKIEPSAHNFTRRGLLRLDIGMFSATLKLENVIVETRRNLDEAVGFFSEAIKLDAKFVEAYKFRSQAYRELGKFELANEDENQARLLDAK